MYQDSETVYVLSYWQIFHSVISLYGYLYSPFLSQALIHANLLAIVIWDRGSNYCSVGATSPMAISKHKVDGLPITTSDILVSQELMPLSMLPLPLFLLLFLFVNGAYTCVFVGIKYSLQVALCFIDSHN